MSKSAEALLLQESFLKRERVGHGHAHGHVYEEPWGALGQRGLLPTAYRERKRAPPDSFFLTELHISGWQLG